MNKQTKKHSIAHYAPPETWQKETEMAPIAPCAGLLQSVYRLLNFYLLIYFLWLSP